MIRFASIVAMLAALQAWVWTAESAAQAQDLPPSEAVPVAAQPPATLTPPKLSRFVSAALTPERLAEASVTSVLLSLAIGADGKVAEATIVESAGEELDAAAITAAGQFEFEPARIGGDPVPVRIQYRYDFKPAAAAAPIVTTLEFGGTVRDRKTSAPLANIQIDLDGTQATTDAAGRFSFPNVAPGLHTLTLRGESLTPVATQEELQIGQRYDATYDVELRAPDAMLESVDLELLIVDQPLRKSIAATTVTADQGARVAGTGGDVIKVVENLPGVARSSVGSAALIVWGASGADTRVYIDDVHIPVLYHEGGYRSVIHSDLVKTVELEPGGYGSPHGRGLGGLVTVGLKPLEADGYHGSLALDAIDAAGSIRGTIGEQFRFAGAVRRSHLDWVLQRVSDEDVGEFVPIPKYWDAQLRAAWVPRDGESLEVGGLFSGDEISRSVVEADPAESKRDSKDTGFERGYLRYAHRLDDGSTVAVTSFFGFDHTLLANRFGAVPAILDTDSTLYGLRSAYTTNPFEFLQVSTGLDVEVVASRVRRSGSITSPPREGDPRVFGQTPSDQVNADDWRTTNASLAPYVQADLSLLDDSLHLIPGVRVEPSIVHASRRTPVRSDLPTLGTVREQTLLEPRFAARWSITEAFALRAAIGIYHQPPLAEDLSAVFGNPKLGAAKAVHYLGGASLKLTEALGIEATAFLSRQSELVTRSPFSEPRESEALVQSGAGRAYGAQVLLRHDLTNGFFGWLSYSLVRSQRKDAGRESYRPFDYDQTHVVTVLASYDIGAGFEAGVRFRFASGYPRTPVVAATYDARTDTFQPVFGATNSIRIPSFYSFDARVTKRFKLGTMEELEVYLDVQNVSDHRNPEEIIYNFDYSDKSYITGLPVLPVLGAKLTW
ncbi:MAG TPA: TonB-dependent receptor [Polyangiales bacterium]|nr:TonB-dependent receptor [Polyangiales bacterium]